MATVPAPRHQSKAELRLAEHRRVRSTIPRVTKGAPEQLRKEDAAVLDSLRDERDAANALIEDES